MENERSFTIYNRHYERMGNIAPNYEIIKEHPEKYKLQEKWLPNNSDAKILDIGCGWGLLLLSLWTTGYRNLTGVDISKSMCETAKKELPDKITIICADGLQFLKDIKASYDLIIIFDVIEHITIDKARELLKKCNERLSPNGSVVIRTPNMSNILASYSRYMDITHQIGYTEWSLFQLLDEAGFKGHQIIKSGLSLKTWKHYRQILYPWRGLGLRELLNTTVHEVLFILRGQNPRPSIYSLNIIVKSCKG